MKASKQFILAVLTLFTINARGQDNFKTTVEQQKNTYLLPNGKPLKEDKFDSLENAWGKNRVLFSHNENDDKNGIIHLIRLTVEMEKEMKKAQASRLIAHDAMLNKPAPLFTLKDLKGKTWTLKDLRGKIVVLNFWFTSCAPCVQEMPELNKLVSEYSNKDVVFLGLTYNTAQQTVSFLERHPFKYHILPNSEEIDKKYHIDSWPITIVIDQLGNIQHIMSYSPKINDELSSIINSLEK